jgi:acyl CoA:acetate/3-ketoacid CoA transferase
MAAKSKNKYDVFNWIKDEVIPSCKTFKQKNSTRNLICNFEKIYDDEELTRELMLELSHAII